MLIFHPFLLEDEERFDVLRWAVERVRDRLPCREVARDGQLRLGRGVGRPAEPVSVVAILPGDVIRDH